MNVPIEQSNSLADLAGRIKAEHEAVSIALKDSVRHAIEAGTLLIEAKEQLKHGQWLPWLRDHCTISERTAQLYMRCAKNRTEIEDQIRNGIADLSLSEAAAMLALSSDIKKLFDFFQDWRVEGLSAEELVKTAAEQGIALMGVIEDKTYNPFFGRSEEEQREWMLFVLFLCRNELSGRAHPKGAWAHVEWIIQRPFQNVQEWLGPEGDHYRRIHGMSPVSGKFKGYWAAFLADRCAWTIEKIAEVTDAEAKQFDNDLAAGLLVEIKPPRRKRGRR
jgi:hypothetical protein